MTHDEAQKKYPMDEIPQEIRKLAVAWCEGCGNPLMNDVREKMKLARDILIATEKTKAEAVQKGSIGFAEWKDKNYKLYDSGRYLALPNFALTLVDIREPHHTKFYTIEKIYTEYIKSLNK